MSGSSAKSSSVEYNWLSPNCGIKVSNICLGTMTFEKSKPSGDNQPSIDEVQSHAILDRYHALGGNFIDTANAYMGGESEEIIGSWLGKHDRSEIVVATKVRHGPNFQEKGPNDAGLSRGAILNNVDKSLRRLNTDYIDLYYSHCWDAGVKIEETLRAFHDVVRSGKVRYVGVSNVSGAQLQKIVDYNRFLGFDQAVVLQQEYNLMERYSDIEVVSACKAEGIALVPYSPLKGGLLTGKFRRDVTDVMTSLAGTRLAWTAAQPATRTWTVAPHVEQFREDEHYWALMDSLAAIGRKYGRTQSQVAIRWVLQKDFVSSVVIGARSVAQLEDSMGAGIGWTLADEDMKALDVLSAIPEIEYPYKFINTLNVNRVRT